MTRIRRVSTRALAAGVAGCAISLIAFGLSPGATSDDENDRGPQHLVSENARRMIEQGRQTFRYDTFGDQAFWGAQLKLHQAIAGAQHGGVGPGVSPNTALAIG